MAAETAPSSFEESSDESSPPEVDPAGTKYHLHSSKVSENAEREETKEDVPLLGLFESIGSREESISNSASVGYSSVIYSSLEIVTPLSRSALVVSSRKSSGVSSELPRMCVVSSTALEAGFAKDSLGSQQGLHLIEGRNW